MKEKQTYLDNPKIANAIEEYDKGKAMRLGGFLGLPSGLTALIGSLGLLTKYWKKE
jgi:hypothetical protein